MISSSASNWVDRGEPPEPKIARALRHFLGFDAPMDDESLLSEACVFVGMVAADASEVQIAAYLGHLEDRAGLQRSAARRRRLEAIAIWHIAKAALTRDRALRLLAGEELDLRAEDTRLSVWLAERIAGGNPEG
jgi:hypothetical protein